jgi:hypothetical protein
VVDRHQYYTTPVPTEHLGSAAVPNEHLSIFPPSPAEGPLKHLLLALFPVRQFILAPAPVAQLF